VAVLPLGTGNDLARTLNWGSGCSDLAQVRPFLAALSEARPTLLDRWDVVIYEDGPPAKPLRRKKKDSSSPTPSRALVMNNYLSVGVDAKAALDFHETRRRHPELFTSQLRNKIHYAEAGAREIMERSLRGFHHRIKLVCDGREIPVPEVEGIMVLNIPNYAGGVDLWASGEGPGGVASINDKRLEVVAVANSFHFAQVHVGIARPLRLAQCKQIEIVICDGDDVPMQVDGEPFKQSCPSRLVISQRGAAVMLQRCDNPQDLVVRRFHDALEASVVKGVINRKQKGQIMEEMTTHISTPKRTLVSKKTCATELHKISCERLRMWLARSSPTQRDVMYLTNVRKGPPGVAVLWQTQT